MFSVIYPFLHSHIGQSWILIAGIWFLVAFLTSITPNDLLMINLSLTKELPVYSDPPQHNSNTNLRATFVSLEVIKRSTLTRFLWTIFHLHENFICHICVPRLKDKMFQEMQERNAGVEEGRLLIFQKQLLGLRTVAARLIHRIRSLEAHTVKVGALAEMSRLTDWKNHWCTAYFCSVLLRKKLFNACFSSF